MPNPFYIVGPTSVGKTAISVEVALRCNAEIIGADAFQAYEGMDILTAKPSRAQRERVRHHLVDAIPLPHVFDVAQYAEAARAAIHDVTARGLVPLVVGGTGMYIRALTHGLAELPGADSKLRAEMESRTLADLQKQIARFGTRFSSLDGY